MLGVRALALCELFSTAVVVKSINLSPSSDANYSGMEDSYFYTLTEGLVVKATSGGVGAIVNELLVSTLA